MALGLACSGSSTSAKAPVKQVEAPGPVAPQPGGKVAPQLGGKVAPQPGPPGQPGEFCEGDQVGRRYTPVQCSPTCTAHATDIIRCVDNHTTVEHVEADCRPCPSAVPPAIADCTFEQMTLRPGEQSPLDMCRVQLRCGSMAVLTWCDGENDGTGTSLCECARDGVRDEHVLKNPYQGEGPGPCFAAAAHCRSPRPHSPGLTDEG
jgi:hypothetical protein